MKDDGNNKQHDWRRASEVIGQPVHEHHGPFAGRVTGLVYDTQNLMFGVQLQAEHQDGFLVIPVRSLNWHDAGRLCIRDQVRPHPLTEQHLPVHGLPVRVARQAKRAFVHDVFIDPQARRIAAFQLTALPGVQQDAYILHVSGENVERWAGELLISPEVLTKLTHSLHTPVRVA